MYYYKTNANGEIYMFTVAETNEGLEGWQETDKEIKTYSNGRMVFAENFDEKLEQNIVAQQKNEEIKANLLSSVDNYLNETVQQRGYDNILSACSYVYSTDEIFKAEGEKALAWRDKVYRKCYDILAEVEAGVREIPTKEELIAELPVLEW